MSHKSRCLMHRLQQQIYLLNERVDRTFDAPETYQYYSWQWYYQA